MLFRSRSTRGYCSTSGEVYLYGGFARNHYVGSLRVDSYIAPNTVFIHMPTAFDSLNEIETLDFCSTVAHEFAHVRTRKHGPAVEIAMRKSVPYGMWSRLSADAREKQRALYGWALSMPLRKDDAEPAEAPSPAPVAAKPATAGPSLIERRAAKAAATLARWQAELERRERAVKRARRKVAAARRRAAYYTKRQTAPAG